jgi:hypothetical protein
MATAKQRNRHLEGGLIVELKTGEIRLVKCTPFNGTVYHCKTGAAFGDVTETPEAEFQASIKKIVSRSRFDKR